MPSEFKLNSSIIDVTLCALDFSFVFFCFLEVLFYRGYLFLFRSINSPLSGLPWKIKLLFSGPRNIYINSLQISVVEKMASM